MQIHMLFFDITVNVYSCIVITFHISTMLGKIYLLQEKNLYNDGGKTLEQVS